MRKTGVCLAGLFLVLASAGSVSAGLVAHWKLDETTGTVVSDSSGNGYDGTLVGDATWVAGMFDGALEVDGSSGHVNLGKPTGWPAGKAARSLCGWGRANTVSSGYCWLVAYGSAATGQAMFIGMYNAALVGGGYNSDDVTVENTWTVGEWCHAALTYDGSTAKVYANGVLVGSASKNWNLTLNAAYLGEQVNSAGEYWNGAIDDVRLYNRRLTEDQVAIVYAGGTPDFTKAVCVSPADGTVGVSTALLQWATGEGAATHTVYFGTTSDLTEDNRVASATKNLFYFHAAGLVGGATYYWRVDEVDASGTIHTGDVWTFVAQAEAAYYPTPADGANNAQLTSPLTWYAGKGALKHHLYFGGDAGAVAAGTADVDQGLFDAAATTFDPGTLDALTTYYWRVDENKAGNAVLAGPVWSFSTVLPVEDFESYNDDDNRIFDSWLDGYANGTGATVGNWESPFAELTIVHDVNQAMPLDYNNVDEPYYSEAEFEFDTAQDWTVDDASTLILYVRGKMGNAVVPLYVGITDSSNKTALVTHPDGAIATRTKWVEWQIPLADFANVSKTRVKKLFIGLGDSENPSEGGKGRMYIDTICLAK